MNIDSNIQEEILHDNKENDNNNILFIKDLEKIIDYISYEYFELNRYKISDFVLNGEEYSCICNNGFIKLHSNKCKSYWLCQNETEHTSKDWKFHISVTHEDLKRAWNLIVKIFINMKCKSGMKVYYLKENYQSALGREITIYVFKYDQVYDQSEIRQDYMFDYCDEHSTEFWLEFISRIEKTLKDNKIRSSGLAKGDLPLGNYLSLRNEAYVKIGKAYYYPPDSYGFNAAQHEIPFNIDKIKDELFAITATQSKPFGAIKSFLFLFFCISAFLFSFGYIRFTN